MDIIIFEIDTRDNRGAEISINLNTNIKEPKNINNSLVVVSGKIRGNFISSDQKKQYTTVSRMIKSFKDHLIPDTSDIVKSILNIDTARIIKNERI